MKNHKPWGPASAAATLMASTLVLGGCTAFSALNLCLPEALTQALPVQVKTDSSALTPLQRQNAELLAGIVRGLGLSKRIELLAVATAKQESNLINTPGGDRDSVGFYQQRDHYGTKAQRMNPVWATKAFIYGLTTPRGSIPGVVDIPGWETMDLQRLAETVQRPKDYNTPRSAYNSKNNNFQTALAIVSKLLGTEKPSTTVVAAQQAAAIDCITDGASPIQALMLALRSQLGSPYSWRVNAGSEFDGSGLPQWAYQKIGVSLPVGASAQWKKGPFVAGTRVNSDPTDAQFDARLALLKPGDLLFFRASTDPLDAMRHVGVYAGNGEMIDAPGVGKDIRRYPVPQQIGERDFYAATRPISFATSASVVSTGDWGLPLKSVTLTSSCGMRFHPIEREMKLHEGQDMAARIGTPVYAVQSGTVSSIGLAGSAGNRLIIRHPDLRGRKVESVYSHLNSYDSAIRVGTTVTKGQVVAKSGNTGGSTGPHFHFEIEEGGIAMEPMTWISSDGRTARPCSGLKSH